ncbi:unnamed protein product [Sympodiomycopsis kandeliae]
MISNEPAPSSLGAPSGSGASTAAIHFHPDMEIEPVRSRPRSGQGERGRQRHRTQSGSAMEDQTVDEDDIEHTALHGGQVDAVAPASLNPAPNHTLFPETPVSLTSLKGRWHLIASSAPIWQARRGVQTEFLDAASNSHTGSQSSTLKAVWTFYEVASFQSKTLLQRIKEHRKQKKAQQNGNEDCCRPGETKEVQSGDLYEGVGKEAHNFFYTPHGLTLQKALGKQIRWEAIGWGTAQDFLDSHTYASYRSSHPQEHDRVDWFIAYVHAAALAHSFISIYIRSELISLQPNAYKILYRDIVDELSELDLCAAQEVGGSQTLSSRSRHTEGNDGEGENGSEDYKQKLALQFQLRRLAGELKLARGI